MYCSKCGQELKNTANFCTSCGSSVEGTIKKAESKQIKKSTSHQDTTPERITKEEYLANTDIKSTDEAKSYLRQLKLLFWLVFLLWAFARGLQESEPDAAALIFLFNFVVLIYFIYFCAKVLKKEKLPRSNAAWCVFFAPLSWFYFYPLITDPLKIILGEKPVPLPLTEEDKERKRLADKKYWRNFWIVVGVIMTLLVLGLIYISTAY